MSGTESPERNVASGIADCLTPIAMPIRLGATSRAISVLLAGWDTPLPIWVSASSTNSTQ